MSLSIQVHFFSNIHLYAFLLPPYKLAFEATARQREAQGAPLKVSSLVE